MRPTETEASGLPHIHQSIGMRLIITPVVMCVDKIIHLTPQRRAVLQMIQESDNHPTAADVMDLLREHGQKISYATVYNSLKFLTDARLVRELKIGDTVCRYDARTEGHHHIVCENCGQVAELLTALPDAYLTLVAHDTGFQVHDIDVVAKGLCPKCQGNSSAPI